MADIIKFPNCGGPRNYEADAPQLCFQESNIDGEIYYKPLNARAKAFASLIQFAYLTLDALESARLIGLTVLIYESNASVG